MSPDDNVGDLGVDELEAAKLDGAGKVGVKLAVFGLDVGNGLKVH